MRKNVWLQYVLLPFSLIIVLLGLIIVIWNYRPLHIKTTNPDKFADLIWTCDERYTPDTVVKERDAVVQNLDGETYKSKKKGKAGRGEKSKAECIERKRSDSDLRAQWVAANSSREMLEYAKAAYWLSLLGFIAGAFTVAFAAWAALASQRSAQAARDTLAAERAWMTSGRSQMHRNIAADTYTYQFGWINSGKSPATNVEMRRSDPIFAAPNAGPPNRPLLTDDVRTFGLLGINDVIHAGSIFLTGQQFRENKDGELDIYVLYRIEYKDIFKPSEHRFTEYFVKVRCVVRSRPGGPDEHMAALNFVGDQSYH